MGCDARKEACTMAETAPLFMDGKSVLPVSHKQAANTPPMADPEGKFSGAQKGIEVQAFSKFNPKVRIALGGVVIVSPL